MAEAGSNPFSNYTPSDPLGQASKALGVAQQAQSLDASKFELALKQLHVLRGVTSSFLADPDTGKTDITKKVQNEVTKLVGMGIYTPAQATQFLKGFPASPAEQYKALITTHANTLSASEQLGAIFGENVKTNTGPGELTSQTPGYPGLPVRERSFVRGGIPPTATIPNEQTQQPEYSGTDQPPVIEQRGGSLTQSPQPLRPPARPGSIAPVAPLQSQATPGAPGAAPVSPQVTPGRTPAAPPMGSEVAAGAAAKGLAEARDEAGNYQERVSPTRNAIEILSKKDSKGKESTVIGPGTEAFTNLQSALQSWGLGEIAGVDPSKVADYNKLRKYMADASSRRAQGIGPHTNDGLAAAVSASPNTKLDNMSALELSKFNLGLDRMMQARLLDFEEALAQGKVTEGRWGSWKAQWATKQDPRAFVYDLMTPEAQQKLLKSLSAVQHKKFEESLQQADKHNLIGDVNG